MTTNQNINNSTAVQSGREASSPIMPSYDPNFVQKQIAHYQELLQELDRTRAENNTEKSSEEGSGSGQSQQTSIWDQVYDALESNYRNQLGYFSYIMKAITGRDTSQPISNADNSNNTQVEEADGSGGAAASNAISHPNSGGFGGAFNSFGNTIWNGVKSFGQAVGGGLQAIGRGIANAAGTFISQLRGSANWNEDTSNKNANCGPTSLAMILGDFGVMNVNPQNANNVIEQVRSAMGAGGNGRSEYNFTDVSQLVNGARRFGLQAREYMGGGASVNNINQELSQGKKVIVNVNSIAGGWGRAEAHFAVVAGIDQNGNYILKDPLNNQATVVSQAQMQAAMADRGGYMVAIGR